jgi:hypothetical protein
MTGESATEKEETEVISVPLVDPVLEFLVKISELGVGVPVTLFVKGTIVTGNIVSFNTYLERIATGIRNFPNRTELDRETFEEITGEIAGAFDMSRPPWIEASDKSEKRQWIHLTNVRVFNPTNGTFCNFANAFWRGSLGSIDGVVIGSPDQTSQSF